MEPLRLLKLGAIVWFGSTHGKPRCRTAPQGMARTGLNIGSDITHKGVHGNFMGVDENFGLLLRAADTTHLFPHRSFEGHQMKLHAPSISTKAINASSTVLRKPGMVHFGRV